MAISNVFARLPRYIFAIISFAMSVSCYFISTSDNLIFREQTRAPGNRWREDVLHYPRGYTRLRCFFPLTHSS